MLAIEGFEDKVIPLRMHGDGVPIGLKRGRSLDAISLSSLVGFRGPSWDSKWLVFSMVDGAKYKSGNEGASTMDVVWRILLWSFRTMLEGVWPSRDWNDRALTG